MDNLTHSVVGLGIGALVDRSLADEPEPEPGRRRLRTRMLLAIACLASNFPDLDLVATRLLEAPLGYLLHHRGHTHTLVGALAELVVLLGLVWLLWPNARALLRASASARAGALAAATAGLLLHIGMDGLNVYGVHPFWPFDPDWFYGDMVFIVEPVFWIAFGVPLAAMVRSKPRRWALFGLMAAVPIGVTLAGFLQWGSLLGLLALGVLLALVERQARRRALTGPSGGRRSRAALAAGLALSIAFVGVQAAALRHARAIVAGAIERLDPGERLLDTALSAFPANPLCWSFVTVARAGHGDGAGADIHLRRGLLSIAPGLAPAASCPAEIGGAAGPAAAPQLAWQSEEREPLAVLRRLRQTNCHVDAWLRFARAPALAPVPGVATDQRWGPPGSLNFSSLRYADLAPLPCPRPVPGWGYPRADLLGLQ